MFGIFFNHHPPPENVAYDMRKFDQCQYMFKNWYEFYITLFDNLFKDVHIHVSGISGKSTQLISLCGNFFNLSLQNMV